MEQTLHNEPEWNCCLSDDLDVRRVCSFALFSHNFLYMSGVDVFLFLTHILSTSYSRVWRLQWAQEHQQEGDYPTSPKGHGGTLTQLWNSRKCPTVFTQLFHLKPKLAVLNHNLNFKARSKKICDKAGVFTGQGCRELARGGPWSGHWES
ncbi:hypothetical protein GOODEAATRI_025362 [Goodea atripinnis]|uniref:Uncharacterized protein n=1 Tax=Goodea atripinnis TaxID=208336 RepID=A0ABV0PRV7_9TELE